LLRVEKRKKRKKEKERKEKVSRFFFLFFFFLVLPEEGKRAEGKTQLKKSKKSGPTREV
jgi:hypothetical protein